MFSATQEVILRFRLSRTLFSSGTVTGVYERKLFKSEVSVAVSGSVDNERGPVALEEKALLQSIT